MSQAAANFPSKSRGTTPSQEGSGDAVLPCVPLPLQDEPLIRAQPCQGPNSLLRNSENIKLFCQIIPHVIVQRGPGDRMRRDGHSPHLSSLSSPPHHNARREQSTQRRSRCPGG